MLTASLGCLMTSQGSRLRMDQSTRVGDLGLAEGSPVEEERETGFDEQHAGQLGRWTTVDFVPGTARGRQRPDQLQLGGG